MSSGHDGMICVLATVVDKVNHNQSHSDAPGLDTKALFDVKHVQFHSY